MEKSMKKAIIAIILLGWGLGVTAVEAAGNAANGKPFYAICLACHGENGEGNPAIHSPTIGGQETWYVERQLKMFKSGVRGTHPKDTYGAQMRPMSMTLPTDQVIADVAAYVNSLQPPAPKPTVEGDASAAEAGFALCAPCHGPRGEGNVTFNAPRLIGQHDWYVVQQLVNFREGYRGTKPEDTYGMQMRPMAMTLMDDAAVRNMAAFIAGLK
jgi:cytochrome c oxidase subunit II